MEEQGPGPGGEVAAAPAGGAPEAGPEDVGVTEPAPSSGAPCRFFLAGSCRFGARCRNPHPGAAPATPRPPPAAPARSKKPPMKTAGDVISRILWDPRLPPGAFTVGHLDRFLGVREDPFTAFSWEDLASAGPEVLAVPQHRIQYFKYRGRVVWAKASRLDDVFGSTGSGRTILEVLEEEEAGAGGSAGARGADGAGEPEGALPPVSEEEAVAELHPPGGPRPPRPTHFVAVRITSPELRASVAGLQETLTRADPALAEFCVPLPSLHLTLCLLGLSSPREIQAAITALRELQTEHRRLLPPAPVLRFQGLASFRDHVLHSAPAPSPELAGLVRALERVFACKGLTLLQPPLQDCFHLTVAKIPAGREQRLNLPVELPPGQELGTQAVESLCLCQVGGGRRTDGFYSTVVELDLY
ncbi:leukocyte receptor cluster member 9 [Carettochelys insculpta]|uniref:leukocyte receptor cluster member 9 n=1 Tax=Carettochelys insculpta TaxID=44489 RepID=UPI003EBEE978